MTTPASPLTYLPTGTCFDDCANAFNDMVGDHPQLTFRDDFVLVHGIMLARDGFTDGTVGPDEPFAHAWLEIGQSVFHPALAPSGAKVMLHRSKKDWYSTYRITDRTRYTAKEVCEQNLKHGTSGPWEERYLKLCKGG